MSTVPWPPSLDALLRTYITLGDGEEITADTIPVHHGLDSMATVSLLLDIEERYQVTIPDDQLTSLATADVGSLWTFLEHAGARV